MTTKQYGRMFLRSLPTGIVHAAPSQKLTFDIQASRLGQRRLTHHLGIGESVGLRYAKGQDEHGRRQGDSDNRALKIARRQCQTSTAGR